MMSSFICSGSFFPFTIPNNQRRQQQRQHVGSFASSFDDDNDFDGTLFGKQSKSKFLFTKKKTTMLFLRLSFFRLFSLCAAAFPFFTFSVSEKQKQTLITYLNQPKTMDIFMVSLFISLSLTIQIISLSSFSFRFTFLSLFHLQLAI